METFRPNEHFVSVFNYDHIHTVPKFEVYVYASLNLMIRVFAWNLPSDHEIYTNHDRSVNNITLSNLMAMLSQYHMCTGVEIDPSFKINSVTKHVIHKVFLH